MSRTVSCTLSDVLLVMVYKIFPSGLIAFFRILARCRGLLVNCFAPSWFQSEPTIGRGGTVPLLAGFNS